MRLAPAWKRRRWLRTGHTSLMLSPGAVVSASFVTFGAFWLSVVSAVVSAGTGGSRDGLGTGGGGGFGRACGGSGWAVVAHEVVGGVGAGGW